MIGVMVVEDDLDLRQLYQELLTHAGFRQISFGDGASALAALTTLKPLPQLIILDFMLPEMNGQQFLDKLSQLTQLASIPVVIVSALGPEDPAIVAASHHPLVKQVFNKQSLSDGRLVTWLKNFSSPNA